MMIIQHQIIWDAGSELGVSLMDSDHRDLADKINDVYDACTRHEWDGSIEHAMAELSYHTVNHFNREEAFMREIGYPGLRAHCKVHQKLTLILDAISDRIGRDKAAAIDEETVDFLKKWLLKHIQHADFRLAEYYRGIGL